MAWTITPSSYPLLVIRQRGLDDLVGNLSAVVVRWSSVTGGFPEGSGLGRQYCLRPPHASSALGLQTMELAPLFHWAGISAMHWTSLHTIRWESQTNNFPFPHREVILGRCLAPLVQCKEPLDRMTGTSRHLALRNVHACTHPKAHESYPLPYMYPVGDSGFSLEKFPVQVHGRFPPGL